MVPKSHLDKATQGSRAGPGLGAESQSQVPAEVQLIGSGSPQTLVSPSLEEKHSGTCKVSAGQNFKKNSTTRSSLKPQTYELNGNMIRTNQRSWRSPTDSCTGHMTSVCQDSLTTALPPPLLTLDHWRRPLVWGQLCLCVYCCFSEFIIKVKCSDANVAANIA